MSSRRAARLCGAGNDVHHNVWREYLAFGQERLASSQRSLARYGRRNAVRARRLYAPTVPPVDQATVMGPP